MAFVWFLYAWYVVPAEERYMRGRFAAAYDDYCRRVPRWLPRLESLAARRDPPAGRRSRCRFARILADDVVDPASAARRTHLSRTRHGLVGVVHAVESSVGPFALYAVVLPGRSSANHRDDGGVLTA